MQTYRQTDKTQANSKSIYKVTEILHTSTVEHAWSRDHATSSVTVVLPPPGQRCGAVCLNSFGNRT